MQIPSTELNWQILEELRGHYLSPGASGIADYWKSAEHLRQYDATFGQRIAWKWRGVLNELHSRYPGIARASLPQVMDFGCGTGVASREWLRFFAHHQSKVALVDRSSMATQFARKQILLDAPNSEVEVWGGRLHDRVWDVSLISHVTNEMGQAGVDVLSGLVKRSKIAVLVEPGTPAAAKVLLQVRDKSLSSHVPLAPCTHALPCGMAVPERSNDWCHHFAKPPREIFRDGAWAEFSKKMRIDLRSLPVSYLVLAQRDFLADSGLTDAPQNMSQGRIIGRARVYKGYSKALRCDGNGVCEVMLQKKDNPELYKELDKDHPFSVII